MKILVTGAKGFVGKNLSVALNNLKENKDRTRPNLVIDEVFEYDIDNTNLELEEFDNKLMNLNITKMSINDNIENCDYDKEYCDRFLKIINNK